MLRAINGWSPFSLLVLRCLLLVTLTGFSARASCKPGAPCGCGSNSNHFGTQCGCEIESFKTNQPPIKLWPGGLIFYKIDKTFSEGFVTVLRKLMMDLENKVGRDHIQFVEATSPSGTLCRINYVSIERETGLNAVTCYSETGVQPNRLTRFQFNEEHCIDKRLLIGLLAAIGLSWESSRADRGKFVKFHPEILMSSICFAYEFSPDSNLVGMEYDPDSFLHYASCDFSCNGEYVVTKLDGSPIREKAELSSHDIGKLRRLYPSEHQVHFIQDKYCLEKPPDEAVILVNEELG